MAFQKQQAGCNLREQVQTAEREASDEMSGLTEGVAPAILVSSLARTTQARDMVPQDTCTTPTGTPSAPHHRRDSFTG